MGLLFYINSYSWLVVATLKSTERARKVDSILISGCDPHCRDKRRRARYQQTRKQTKQNKLSQQQNTGVPAKPDTKPKPKPQEASVLLDNAAVGANTSASLETSKSVSAKPASRTNPTLELPGSVIKTRSMTRSTASISTTPRAHDANKPQRQSDDHKVVKKSLNKQCANCKVDIPCNTASYQCTKCAKDPDKYFHICSVCRSTRYILKCKIHYHENLQLMNTG